MRKHALRAIVSVFFLGVIGTTYATVTVVDPNYSAVLRSTTKQPFPLEIGPGGTIYTITGTSVTSDLVRIGPTGTVQTLNANVGFVVGVGADLEFGFGGDLFANIGTDVISTPDGVARFNSTSGASSAFYVNEVDYADGGLAYDSGRQRLFMTNEERDGVVAIDSSGNGTVLASNATPNAWGMAQQSTGRLLVLDRITGNIITVDPDTGSTGLLANLGLLLPGYQFTSIDVDQATNEIYFIAGQSSPTSFQAVYSLSADGTGLHTIATDPGLLAVKVGPSSAAGGGTSVYVGNPQNSQITELRIVPEPGVLAGIAFFTAILVGPRRRR